MSFRSEWVREPDDARCLFSLVALLSISHFAHPDAGQVSRPTTKFELSINKLEGIRSSRVSRQREYAFSLKYDFEHALQSPAFDESMRFGLPVTAEAL